MFSSLRARLVLAFMAIVLLAIGTVVGVTLYTNTQVRGFVSDGHSARQMRMVRSLATYYEMNRTWSGVAAWVEQMGDLFEERVSLVDAEGILVAGYRGAGMGRMQTSRDGTPCPITVDGEVVGTLHVWRESRAVDAEEAFLVGLGRSAVWAGAVAAVSGVGIALWLTRRTLRPVRELTLATRRMQAGELDQRVTVSSRDEIGELGTAFNAMAAALTHQEDLRRQMVSDVAHELRSPLANARGYLEAIRDGVLDASAESLDTLHEEVMLLARLVDDLQDLALAEAGALPLAPEPVSVESLMDRALAAVAPAASRSGVTLERDVAADLPDVQVDRQRVLQVLGNLLGNALRHTPRDGTITLGAKSVSSWVEFRVQDTGSGIPGDQLERVFERFHRVDSARSRATGGAGLGLTVARRLVESHGGRIWAENALEGGAILRFTLPAATSESDTP